MEIVRNASPFLVMLAAVLLDAALGEPRRFHPLVGFGRGAAALERWLYAPSRVRGALVLALVLLPPTLLAACLSWNGSTVWMSLVNFAGLSWLSADYLGANFSTLFSIWALYFALGQESLHAHVRPIIRALRLGDDAAARDNVAKIVSRDKDALEIIPSACETVLENGNDGVFGALFWFICAGAPGAILYRLANTLDAMWGYKNPRYLAFGWAAARFDDCLNWIPARLTALTYALLGKTRQALRCWRTQAPTWDSPNAGPVMAAGAGALNIRLGGAACYAGKWHERPSLGGGLPPQIDDIERALALVRHGVILWLLIFCLWERWYA